MVEGKTSKGLKSRLIELSIFWKCSSLIAFSLFAISWALIRKYDGGTGFHILFPVLTGSWAMIPLLSKFFFLEKNQPLGWLVSIYPSLLKVIVLFVYMGLLALLSLMSLGFYINYLIKT